MFFNAFVTRLTRLLCVVALTSTIYLYLYPIWLGCVFPSTDGTKSTAFRDTVEQHLDAVRHAPQSAARHSLAPFRLLVLADPQLEGDSSLPKREDALHYKLSGHWRKLNVSSGRARYNVTLEILKELVIKDIPREFQAWRKRLDLLGNDFYLAHIFRSLHWWTKPTHITVLGDLIGSQWVDDAEFSYRGWRYWNRVFARAHRIEDDLMTMHEDDGNKLLPMDDGAWARRMINIAGNHDIGYAGDISGGRMSRFETTFGRANWDVRFAYPSQNASTEVQPTLHMIVLNSMLLDGPTKDEREQGRTYEYLNSIITQRSRPVEDRSSFTLLLTHVPLHKREGICVDGPFFDYFGEDQTCKGKCLPDGLKEQNHLSEHSSQSGILQSIFGMNGRLDTPAQGKGRSGLILNGHDHEGCDVWHYIPKHNTTRVVDDHEEPKTVWEAAQWKDNDSISAHTGLREKTLRSMMGEFGGNAGLLSLWFDFHENEWKMDIQTCQIGVQHIWWAVHVVDIIALALLCFQPVLARISQRPNIRNKKPDPQADRAKKTSHALTSKKQASKS